MHVYNICIHVYFVCVHVHVGECCSVEASLWSLHHCLQSVYWNDRGHHVWREYRAMGWIFGGIANIMGDNILADTTLLQFSELLHV